MVGSISSNYPSYTSTSTSTTAADSARREQFQKNLFAKLDTNGDGTVSQDELKAAQAKKPNSHMLANLSKNFAALDSDNSGGLSSEEMAAMAPPQQSQDQPPSTELADALLSVLDTNGNGSISSDELNKGLSSVGSSADSSQIFSALDTNQDGTVSADELAAALSPPPPPPQQVSGDQLFSQLDSDGDGSISATELSSALQASTGTSSTSTSTDTSAALLKVLDTDGSGGVSSNELKAALQAGREQNSGSSSAQSTLKEALNAMIASISKQYAQENVTTVGTNLNVTT
ncbi:EF-hand domain-containing protein [Pseudomonas sp. 681]|uniref:EF-hand domain-containing protein n=1 Tax=Pseudomonas fungipugnans TaxID=3024217 RepID=A0ABT6QKK4_9PSED|nr:EF-hand domain-containing protein [Pseudomonas sp. 681]MDI2591394.1 EF-hand domain-containing protein [Pseudomonas sp. 681]